MKAKIYQPAKSATQSAKSNFWLLEFNAQDKPNIDNKMLWTSSSNTQDKVKIRFSDKDKAVKFAQDNKIDAFSACFDETSAKIWNDFDAPAFKIASGDITHHRLLQILAGYNKPLILYPC